ncbi:MAG TPA: kelch repeat-containing protein [Streptosporangiaceae bacterium]|jgi:N-acetylneuraminic acid mutarotase
MSQLTAPQIAFDTYYMGDYNQVGEVDLSLDGGQTWSSVWQQTSYSNVSGHVEIPIPQAAGQPDVQVRFHFTASYGWYWEIDNVLVGQQTCAPVRAGILAGAVTDANTGAPLGTVTVASAGGSGTSVAATDGTGLPTGYYWLVSTQTGSQSFTATDGTFTGTDGNYTPVTATVNVAPNAVTRQNWAMPAGQLTVSTHAVSATETLGGTKTAKITLGNDGTEPLRVTLGEHGEGVTPMASGPGGRSAGAPLHRVKVTGPVWFGAAAHRPKSAASGTHPARAVHPARAGRTEVHSGVPGQAWASLADYPSEIMDSAVGYDDQTGTIYSAGGFNGYGYVASAYAFSPASQQWTAIAALPQALESAESAFIDGTFYVAGGWTQAGTMSTAVYAYDPSANTWTQVAAMPLGLAGGAATVLGGDMYIVGGCSTANCIPTSGAVYRFDPAAGRWTQLASYPAPVAFEACGGVDGEIACAGGENVNTTQATAATYLYDPAANTWTAGADMPYNDVGMSYSAANGDLQVVGGITSNQTVITNQASQYDPVTGAWTALPNANDTVWRGCGGCGMYQIGGTTGLSFTPVSVTQALPGYGECGAQDVPWLSEGSSTLDLAPGASASVTVTLGSAALTQPGTYTADLAIGTDSPYFAPPVAVSLTVTPPKTWGKIAGTVTDASTGQPIAGASLQICTMYDKTTGSCGSVSYSLQTGDNGTYQLWLAKGYNPLQVVASMNGYQAQAARMTITAGATTTRNFALQPAPPP